MQKFIKIIQEIPRMLGVRFIPDLFPNKHGKEFFALSLKGYCQTDNYSCGVIAGWSALEALNPKADFAQFDKTCAPTFDNGTSIKRLTNALRKQGIKVGQRQLDFKTIKEELHLGHPILVSIKVKNHDDVDHWVCLYGYAENPRRILCVGRTIPGFSRKRMPWRKFKPLITPPSLVLSVLSVSAWR